MWSLLRMFLIGRLLGGRGAGGMMGGARKGCGCMSLLMFLVIIALVVYSFRACGPNGELQPTGTGRQDTYGY